MAKARELPSGNWRVQVSTGVKKPNGKFEYVSFTDPDPRVAERDALSFQIERERSSKTVNKMTLREAYQKFIDDREGVLSPSTVKTYKDTARLYLQELMEISIYKLDNSSIQKCISELSKKLSPKTVRNIHGLLSAVLNKYHPDFKLDIDLPQKKKYIPSIPNETEVAKILKLSKGAEIELPILLATWLGLRLSEIRGLTLKDVNIEKKTITIRQALVLGEDGYSLKSTKAYESTRVVPLPDYIAQIIEKLPKDTEYIVPQTVNSIRKRFSSFLKANKIDHCRFHDLRHANASIMLALNVPDKYAMKRMGHATTNMLKTVYQHTMEAVEQQLDNTIQDYFNTMIGNEKSHEKSHTE